MVHVNRRFARITAASMYSRGKRRNVVLILEPPGNLLRLRLAGERKTIAIGVSELYALAARATALAKRREREEARKKRKSARDCR